MYLQNHIHRECGTQPVSFSKVRDFLRRKPKLHFFDSIPEHVTMHIWVGVNCLLKTIISILDSIFIVVLKKTKKPTIRAQSRETEDLSSYLDSDSYCPHDLKQGTK